MPGFQNNNQGKAVRLESNEFGGSPNYNRYTKMNMVLSMDDSKIRSALSLANSKPKPKEIEPVVDYA